ncbi:hypothetical protein AD998_21225 [bacterium 336/3]|nr:hypothetical protein AD998_21225 [bacterium 336/3]
MKLFLTFITIIWGISKAYCQQPLTNFQPADMVLGRPDFTSTSNDCEIFNIQSPTHVAISSKGIIAANEQSYGKVKLWTQPYSYNGQPSDLVLGKFSNTFCDAQVMVADYYLTSCDGIAFSPDGNKILASDSYNNRILIWNTIPTTNGKAADVVIGQVNFTTNSAGTSSTKLRYPTALYVTPDGRLIVSDRNNHRILIWNTIPTTNGKAADIVIGQVDFNSNEAGTSSSKLKSPWGVYISPDGKLFVADTNNDRVMVWNSIPTTNGQPADIVIGQADFNTVTSGTSSTLMNKPSGVTVSPTGRLVVGEFANNRALVYNSIPTTNGQPADVVLGQADFSTSTYYHPNGFIDNKNMAEIYNAAFDLYGRLFVVGRFMDRALIFGTTPTQQSNIGISVTTSNTNPCKNSRISLTFTLTNHGTQTVNNIVATGAFPVAFSNISHSLSSGTYNMSSGYWNIPSIAPGATQTLTLEGDATTSGNFRAYGSILLSSHLDNNMTNNGTFLDFNISNFAGTIQNNTLSNATQGLSYSETLTTNLTSPVWSLSEGSLPNGLTFNTSTGEISGIPTTIGTFQFKVKASAVCVLEKSFTIIVNCPNLIFNNTSVNNGVVGLPFNLDAGVTGNTLPLTYSINPSLPAGLSLDTNTGLISGTPEISSPNTTYTVTASQGLGGSCQKVQTYTFAINCPNLTFNNTSVSNGVVGTSFSLDASVAGNTQPLMYSITPSLPAGLSLDTNTGLISGTPVISSPNTTYTATASQNNGACSVSQTYIFAINCPPLIFTNTSASTVIVGVNYNLDVSVTGNTQPLTYSIIPSLPSGLSLDTNTGLISGTPTTSTPNTTYTVTASQNSGACSISQTYTFAVNCPPLTFVNPNTNFGIVGVSYSLNASVVGNTQPLTYSIAPSLPAGLSLNTTTGMVTGMPTNISSLTSYTVTASQNNSNCLITKVYDIAIDCPNTQIQPSILSNAKQYVDYTQNISQTGLVGNITWSVVGGNLPIGFTLNSSTGIISGKTNSFGVFHFVVEASTEACISTKTYSLNIIAYEAILDVTDILDFGDVFIGESSKKTIRIKNTGVDVLQIKGITSNSLVFKGQWLGDILSNQTQQVEIEFTPIKEESYEGFIKISSNATQGDSSFIVKGRGIKKPILPWEVSVSPNPTLNEINIQIQSPTSNELIWTLRNVLGQTLKVGKKTVSSEIFKFAIELNQFPQGMYLLQIEDGFIKKTIKIQKL